MFTTTSTGDRLRVTCNPGKPTVQVSAYKIGRTLSPKERATDNKNFNDIRMRIFAYRYCTIIIAPNSFMPLSSTNSMIIDYMPINHPPDLGHLSDLS